MPNLLERIKNNTTIAAASYLSDSNFVSTDMVPTDVPAVNIALSGSVDGGLTSGITTIAGPSKHFKTAFGLLLMKAYLDSKPNSIALFYDSEFGTPQKYFETFNIDTNRVLHTPVTDIEELKIDLVNQLKEISSDDDVFIFVDSIGNLFHTKKSMMLKRGKPSQI